MSLLLMLVIFGVLCGCVMLMMPSSKKTPIAVFSCEDKRRRAELRLYPGNRYELDCQHDDTPNLSESGTYRREGEMEKDGSVLFLDAPGGDKRQLVFNKTVLHVFSEEGTVNPALSIALMDFLRRI